jgi:NADPH:quinone reductase-like Zn-dependent oxidoreductase
VAAREFAPGGLDAAVVTVGGETADQALSSVRDGGRVASPYGVMPDPNVRPGVTLIRYNGARCQDATCKLNRLIDSGPFDVHVARTVHSRSNRSLMPTGPLPSTTSASSLCG